MAKVFFSPNKKITGGALFASFNSKDGNVYLNVFPQIADNANKKDNFDFKSPITVKLTSAEAAGIVRANRDKKKSKFFHTFDGNTTTGEFGHYLIPAKDTFPEREGFGWSFKKGDKTIKVGFTLETAEDLSHFLTNALSHINDAIYSEDVAKGKEYAKSKASNSTPSKSIEQKVDPQNEQSSTEGEIDF